MKIKTKILIGLSTLPILIILLIGIGWFQLNSLNKISNTLQNNYDLALLSEQIHNGIKDEAISLRNVGIFTDEESIQKELTLLKSESESVTNMIDVLESNASNEQRPFIKELKETNAMFNDYKDRLIELISTGKREEAIQLINNEGHEIHEEFFQRISVITENYETNMDKSIKEFSTDLKQDIIISSIISFLGLLVVISLIVKNVLTLANRLKHMSSVMTSIANGETDIGAKVEVTSKDEIGEVAHSFNVMAGWLEEQTKKEQSLLWVKTNIADVTTDLSGTHDVNDLAQKFLSKVAPLTESSHAVFYVKESDEKTNEPIFRLLASYAFKERKHLSNTFRVGEGLVGQAALEKKPIIIGGVPSDYIRVTSGLGEAPPLHVYVLPAIYKGDVVAVLEMASFQPFNKDQQALLEELMNGIGVIFDSVMGRIRLAKSLEEQQTLTEEVQAQSEELQSQQEELKTTNEELEEQTQALRQSEEKLQVQQEELEQTNTELKEKAHILEEQNKRFELQNREVEKARAELEEKAKQLTLSSKYKSEFLANMSHELRTPLNSLLILSKLLADNIEGNLSDKQVEYSKTIHSSGSDLLTLINDILDLAKIESGKVEVQPQNVEIQDIVELVEQSFRPLANEKELYFTINMKSGIPRSLYSDGHRLQQVLRNLLANAFKFTKHGAVTLEVDYLSKLNKFSFSIIDTGIGIPKEKWELIFEAFQQVDGTTSRKYGGTGLGLSICREIASFLGGEIVVESEEGKGSTFTFYVGNYEKINMGKSSMLKEAAVSLDQEEEKHEVIHSHPTVTNEVKQIPIIDGGSDIKRLLIVDDDVTQRNSIMELIGDKNVILKGVSTGAEAIEELKQNQYDCIILDLGLSDTTGFDLLGEIKAKVENENVKVFIYTGRDLSSKEEMYLTKYAHTIIIKDSHAPQRLKDELELFLDGKNKKVEVTNEPVVLQKQNIQNLIGKKVLLVDDDVRNVFALSSILELYGLDITFAENGKEALQLLDKYVDDFDIVLMDIMMPEMDGYEAIRRMRENPTFEDLPVIALTAKAMKEDRDKCMAAGASDYIVKPVDPEKLISLIKVWLYT